jgi:hypothetical protein
MAKNIKGGYIIKKSRIIFLKEYKGILEEDIY